MTDTKDCSCKLSECICPEDNCTYEWQWDATNLNPSTVLSDDKHDILFHKTFSTGTAAVRGTQPFALNLHYYWEIRILTTLYGTDVMIGIGTDAVDLNLLRNRFCRMLGHDSNSWGYSYRGEVQYKGEFYKYGASFDRGSVIGCHLDMCKGTLEFYHNRERLGVAFTNLKQYACRLYPIVCSTAAQSALRLNCALIIKPTLQFIALRKLKKRDKLQDIFRNAPPGLKRILQKEYWWLIEPVTVVEKITIVRGMLYSSEDEVVASKNSRRKRKRSKKGTTRAARSVSEDAAQRQQEGRLMDGPTSVETLRVLRSHTRNARQLGKCERCSCSMPTRAGPRTRRLALCSSCDGK